MGASNLARGYSMLTHHLSECLKKNKIEFFNALGPGRGFCARGGIFNITYSPIQDSQVIESAEKKSGRIFFKISRMPELSSWNTPVVLPSHNISKVRTLLKGMDSI